MLNQNQPTHPLLPEEVKSNFSDPMLPPLPGLDTKTALKNMGKNVTLYLEIISRFRRSQRNICQTMTDMLLLKEWSHLERTAHTLKGIAAAIGATELSQAARLMELGVKEGSPEEVLRSLLKEVANQLDATLRMIDGAIPEPKERLPWVEGEKEEATDLTALAPLIKQAEYHLQKFDSHVDEVFLEMAKLVKGNAMRDQLHKLKKLLGIYDYEACLILLRQWANQIGVSLDKQA